MILSKKMTLAAIALGGFLPISNAAEPILYFPMEEDSGSIFDQLANREASPIDTGQLYQQEGPPGFGDAIALDGNGSWQLSVADSTMLRNLTNDFTVAAWLYLDSETLDNLKTGGTNFALNRFIGDDLAWDRDGWAMGVFSNGRVRFTKNGIVDVDVGAVGAFPRDEWAHFAASVSSTEGVTLYVNGEAVGSNPDTADILVDDGDNNSDDPYAIGRAYGDGEEQWFGGRIDEVRVFDCVLSLAQVQGLLVPLRDPALVTENNLEIEANGASMVIDIPVLNEGENEDLQITGITFSGVDDVDFSLVTTLPLVIAPGMEDTVQINFTPTNGTGDYEATMTLDSNDPQRTSFEVILRPNVRDPWLVVEGGTDFGILSPNGGAVTTMVTVRNRGGTETLELADVISLGTNEDQFTVNGTFPLDIAPGGTEDIMVTFDPGMREGRIRGELEIDSNDSEDNTETVILDSRILFADFESHLVSRFAFDDPANPGFDSGMFGNNATFLGDAELVGEAEARIGTGAIFLDGADDYLEATGSGDYSSLLDDGEGFTLAAWVCPTPQNTAFQSIASTFADNGVEVGGWEAGYSRGGISRLIGNTSQINGYTQPGVPAGPPASEWTHLGYVFSGAPTNSIEFFVNGASIGTTVAGENDIGINPGGNLLIGTRDPLSGFFFGKIDDLRVYDAELTATEFEEIINAEGLIPIVPPRITNISLTGSGVSLTWESRDDRIYTVERSMNDLNLNQSELRDWSEVATSIDSAGETTTFEDTSIPAETERAFYRVIEELVVPPVGP